jgi:hypothetical protein
LPSTITVIPDQTRLPRCSTPTTSGSPSARATIAVCDVRPPPSVQKAAASARPSCATSAGDRSCPMAMLPLGVSSTDDSTMPNKFRSNRSPTMAMSLRRSRKYGSSMRSKTDWIWSSARRTAQSAEVLSSRM